MFLLLERTLTRIRQISGRDLLVVCISTLETQVDKVSGQRTGELFPKAV